MYLKQLTLRNYRNHVEFKANFAEGVNVITGKNGTGKTNMLDAIYYLSVCRSYFIAIDQPLVRQGEDFFFLEGVYFNMVETKVDCTMRAGGRKVFKLNNNVYPTLAEHIGSIPVVIVTPLDIALIYEGSEERRRFLDIALSQTDREYLLALSSYKRCLEHRNSLLRNPNGPEWEDIVPWDVQLVQHGKYIHQKRNELIKKLSKTCTEIYQQISGGGDEIGLEYISQLNQQDFENLLEKGKYVDSSSGRSNFGIHKDDLNFHLGGQNIRRFGSQGQQKTYIFSLKLALFKYLKTETKKAPILLLDDLFEKLDSSRLSNLVSMVSRGEFGQVFITDTDRKRTEASLKGCLVDVQFFEL
ncbi:MAG: DNA replication and repair protein RecF [Flavobacteriaceae bacterium]|nr:DNA replication and repair protein RecF [Flavobacteriaceae bacterium]